MLEMYIYRTPSATPTHLACINYSMLLKDKLLITEYSSVVVCLSVLFGYFSLLRDLSGETAPTNNYIKLYFKKKIGFQWNNAHLKMFKVNLLLYSGHQSDSISMALFINNSTRCFTL